MPEQSGATSEIRTLTIGDIIKALTPAGAWSLLAAMVAVLGGVFTLGQHLGNFSPSGNFTSSKSKAETDPVPCYRSKGWPKGVWLVWGHIESDWKPTKDDKRFPQIATRVTFDSSTSFITQSDHVLADATKNGYRATLSSPIEPGAAIQIHGRDGTGYTSDIYNGVVSNDGCMIKGDFTDSLGHRGSVNYLFESSRYYVDP
jgi:hypothetical protein